MDAVDWWTLDPIASKGSWESDCWLLLWKEGTQNMAEFSNIENMGKDCRWPQV